MYTALQFDDSALRYRGMLGTGGIGTGLFFALNGNHTLGREESRTGRFLDRRDYCKLHIISHYLQVLLGPRAQVCPIGCVGADDPGRRLLEEMRETGMSLQHVHVLQGEQTMNCICFVYPDGSGGNMTVDDSASARVTPEQVAQAEPQAARMAGAGIALSVPEVPLPARRAVLELGSQHGLLRVTAVTSAEAAAGDHRELLAMTDLLALNIDEAAAMAGCAPDTAPSRVVDALLGTLASENDRTMVAVTAGAAGSWLRDGGSLDHRDAFPAEVAGTAGAGDAFLSGLLAGLATGLDSAEAHALAALCAAVAVTSPHTIHPQLDANALRAFAQDHELELGTPCMRRLGLPD